MFAIFAARRPRPLSLTLYNFPSNGFILLQKPAAVVPHRSICMLWRLQRSKKVIRDQCSGHWSPVCQCVNCFHNKSKFGVLLVTFSNAFRPFALLKMNKTVHNATTCNRDSWVLTGWVCRGLLWGAWDRPSLDWAPNTDLSIAARPTCCVVWGCSWTSTPRIPQAKGYWGTNHYNALLWNIPFHGYTDVPNEEGLSIELYGPWWLVCTSQYCGVSIGNTSRQSLPPSWCGSW